MTASWNGFQSILATQIEQYLRAKRAMGCKFACEERQLRLLDRFLDNRGVERIEAIDAQCLQEFLDSRQRSNPRCVFRNIRPPIPITSGHLFRRIRPPVTRCREAACFGYQV